MTGCLFHKFTALAHLRNLNYFLAISLERELFKKFLVFMMFSIIFRVLVWKPILIVEYDIAQRLFDSAWSGNIILILV